MFRSSLALLVIVVAVLVRGEGEATDPCLSEHYAQENYSECCAHGNYKQPDHSTPCNKAARKLKKGMKNSEL